MMRTPCVRACTHVYACDVHARELTNRVTGVRNARTRVVTPHAEINEYANDNVGHDALLPARRKRGTGLKNDEHRLIFLGITRSPCRFLFQQVLPIISSLSRVVKMFVVCNV